MKKEFKNLKMVPRIKQIWNHKEQHPRKYKIGITPGYNRIYEFYFKIFTSIHHRLAKEHRRHKHTLNR